MLRSEQSAFAGAGHASDDAQSSYFHGGAEPVGRFSPAQFRLCIAALGVAVLKVPAEHVVAELCRRLDHYIVAESEADHSAGRHYSTGTPAGSQHNNNHHLQQQQQQRRRWEAVQLVSWASVGTMASPDIGQKLRAKFLHCARELNVGGGSNSSSAESTTMTESPRIRQADVVWIMEQFHLSPEYMSLAELQKEVKALLGASRNYSGPPPPPSTRRNSSSFRRPNETPEEKTQTTTTTQTTTFDFPTFLGVVEKLATAKATTVSLATFAERAHAKSRAEREARELKENPNIFPDDDDQDGNLDLVGGGGWDHTNASGGGRGTGGGALVRYSQVPVRALPEAGRLDASVLQEVVQALEQNDPFRTGVVPVDTFQHCLSPLDRAQVRANVSLVVDLMLDACGCFRTWVDLAAFCDWPDLMTVCLFVR